MSSIDLDKEMRLETGDIILFQGSGCVSWILEFFGRSRYSHAGIVIRNPRFLCKDLEDGLYVLESYNNSSPDSEDGKLKIGVQIHPLEEAAQRYGKGCTFVRYVSFKRDEEFYKNFTEIHKTLYDKPYDFNPLDWLTTLFNIDNPVLLNSPKYRETNSFWCSAMCSYILCKLGAIQPEIDWTLIAPKELSSSEGTILRFTCEASPDTLLC